VARKNFGGFRMPQAPYRADKDAPESLPQNKRLEIEGMSQPEDGGRAKGLRRPIVLNSPLIRPLQARALARRLEKSANDGDYPHSMACALFMRWFRYRFIGALWRLYAEQLQVGSPKTFTIIPRAWEFRPEELMDVDPRRLMASLRSILYKMGAKGADGWLIVFLHGEYDPVAGVFRIHVHGLASLEMIQVVKRLRELPQFKTRRLSPTGVPEAIYRPVRISWKPLADLPAPLSYLAQSFWPSRAIYVDQYGKNRRQKLKRRIPEPYHSLVLLWLDRWHPDDLMLRIHLLVRDGHLIPTRGPSG
jgi:hypothetical protein